MNDRTALYRFFSSDGTLLYIGISKSAIRRMMDHADEKSWWHSVARSTIEYRPTRKAALEAERLAIIEEKPLHNVTHNGPQRGNRKPDPRDGKLYGPWRYEAASLTLQLEDQGRWYYEIDLERCTTSAETLDWIMQVAGKTWVDSTVVAGLVEALEELLDPQSTLCSSGVERGPIGVARTIARVHQRDEEFDEVFGKLLIEPVS